jgi:tyrosyl-tRNA synthetase
MKTMKNKEKFVITMKLLEDNTGKKMGKTEGNMVSFSDTPEDMYGKIMSWADSLIVSGFELCTNTPMFEIEEIKKEIIFGKINPRDYKMRLAREILVMYFGEKKTKQAEENFINTFQKNEIPENIENILVNKDDLLVDIFLENKIVSSKTEFRRLVDNKAITNLDLDEKVLLHTEKSKSGVYRIGKKRFCKIYTE